MRATPHHALLIGACLAVLAACAEAPTRPLLSPFSERSAFGYSEQSRDDTHVEVTYKTPFDRTSLDPARRGPSAEGLRELANDLALWRAAQIAGERGFPGLRVADRRFTTKVDEMSQTLPQRYGLADPRGGALYVQSPSADLRAAWIQGEATLVVELKRAKGADDEDAAAIVAQMSQKYGTSTAQ